MVTEDEKIQQWCQQQSVCTLSYQEYQESNYQGYVLFSIANSHIIPRNLIEKHKVQHAINYHNALLPSYAGTNPTTWAIINGEKKHGVTWHKISGEIDAGDIIRQEEITISREDTTYSLNMKCTQKALALFKILLSDLSNNQLQFQAQALNERSYFSLNHSLKNHGFINGCESLTQISRYCHALDFGGDQSNQIATAKLSFKGSVYLLGVPIWVEKPKNFFDLKGLYIVSKDKALHFPSIYNCYGIEKNISKIISFEELQKYNITLGDDQYHQLKHIKKQERSYALAINSLKNKVNSTLHLSMNHTTQESLEYSINTLNLSTTQIIGAISLVLLRIFHQNNFLVSCYVENPDLRHLSYLVDTKYMIELKQVLNEEKLLNFQEYIQNNSLKKQNITKDFYYRYNCMELLTDIAIYQGNSFDTIFAHKLNFVINNGQLNITGIKTDSIELKGIVSALTTMFKHYKYYLNSGAFIKDIPLLSKEEYQKIIVDWNNTDKPYPRDKTICQLFEEQVEKTPNHIAIVFEEKQFTYKELNAKSNQLARYLKTLSNIQPDDLIAICLDKSLEMIVGILGILKSGAAYVPIDPNSPNERVKYILDDTKTSLLLSQSQYVFKLKNISKAIIIPLDELSYKTFPVCNLNDLSSSDNLACTIYTSGTTGRPKGVLLTHKNIISLVANNYIEINKQSVFSYLSSPAFDASFFETWTPLLSGAKLIIPNSIMNLVSDIKTFKLFLISHKINVLWLTKSLFNSLFLNDNTIFQTIKYLLVGGEALEVDIINKVLSCKHRPRYLINGYGPTESTTFAASYHINKKINLSSVPIGRPLNHRKVYVLDSNQQPLSTNIIGELYISGEGLARGYLNQPKLTAEKFILNPFASGSDNESVACRLYKTGDLVRWLSTGDLEFIGRKDTQIKLRGFRVELAEIENSIMAITNIQQAVVINKVVNDEQHLFAYFTSNSQMKSDLVIEQLKSKLPHYMIPSAILQIHEIPLTANGKTDINALPDIDFRSTQTYIKPRNQQERIICQAFSNVLSIERVGIDDDFFALGGSSIKAIQLTMLLQEKFKVEVSEIFELRTPRKLAYNKDITNNLLKVKLEKIKHSYAKQQSNLLKPAALLKKKLYLSEVANMPTVNNKLKKINNILLTGATGFLGCNLLHQLLISTNYQIYLCIRAENEIHAIQRITRKYQFYFGLPLEAQYGKRITYIVCDLEKKQIGLSDSAYYKLIQSIDSIIHCAALVKHYGIEQVFYNANVQATINLLELCELTKLKDFHYISTYSIMHRVDSDQDDVVHEGDFPKLHKRMTVYNRTKALGELKVISAREKGITSNIYRVGNMALMLHRFQTQENFNDNAFNNYLQFLCNVRQVPIGNNVVEVSPADLTAKAIITLFDKDSLRNQIFHPFNPNRFDISKVELMGDKIQVVSMQSFISTVTNSMCQSRFSHSYLHLGWNFKDEFIDKFSVDILQQKTTQILSNLGFQWEELSYGFLENYFEMLSNQFLEENTNEIRKVYA
ncbi:amino acid adenylation domain-containing protein [Cysteiniphilum sp. 6C5]|uniref:amino acid adenylation domain-containing protein n=1 Tax=unclassified Cysteiniphilum TaxID=2610889 RepID=UPI003F865CB5